MQEDLSRSQVESQQENKSESERAGEEATNYVHLMFVWSSGAAAHAKVKVKQLHGIVVAADRIKGHVHTHTHIHMRLIAPLRTVQDFVFCGLLCCVAIAPLRIVEIREQTQNASERVRGGGREEERAMENMS